MHLAEVETVFLAPPGVHAVFGHVSHEARHEGTVERVPRDQQVVIQQVFPRRDRRQDKLLQPPRYRIEAVAEAGVDLHGARDLDLLPRHPRRLGDGGVGHQVLGCARSAE